MRITYLFGISILLFASIFFLPFAPMAYISLITLFTVFDVNGWGCIPREDRLNNKIVLKYRILQLCFAIIISVPIGLKVGWWTVGYAILAWYLLACDVLYYWAINLELANFTYWVYSPVVYYWTKIKKTDFCPASWVDVSAKVGFLLGLILSIFWS